MRFSCSNSALAIFGVFFPSSWKNAKHLENYTGWAQFWHKNLHNCFLSVFALKSSNCGGTYVWKSFYIVIIYGLSRQDFFYYGKTWNGKILTSNKGKNIPHYKCLQGTNMFFLQYLWKSAVRITVKPYTPQREMCCMLWGNPVIFKDCAENPMITIGFTTTYTIFPFEKYRVFVILTALFYRYCRHICSHS